MKRFIPVLFILICATSFAQTVQRHKIAIFTPLYLDSVFNATDNFQKNTIPKYAIPGLEFYQGAQAALDSLKKKGAMLEVFILDSRGDKSIPELLDNPELGSLEMIIAQSNATETKQLADVAQKRKIPFISANLPNDVSVTNNPYFVILNSTLQAHVENIYRFLQKYHSKDRIIVFRKTGSQEDQLKQNFIDFSKNTTTIPLNIKYVDIGSNFTEGILAAHLDSTKKNICIAGSLDESFGQKLMQNLSALSTTYTIRVIGMPTWEKFNFSKTENLEVVYSTPFYYNKSSVLENRLSQDFFKPGDMFFRGYETTLRFSQLLINTKKDIASNLTFKGNTVFTQFDIQPVFKDKSMTLDYFENKHLYFIKAFKGIKNILY